MSSLTRRESTCNSVKFALSLGAGALALTALSLPAIAQESEEDTSRTLQKITVTATKREQTLQDVPVAVSVVGEDEIEKAEIQDLNDLQSIVPSLRVGQLQSSANTNFIIRGFGNGANNAGIEPSVGVFIDGVYRSRSAAQIADLPNLERVEVLRGPQSTLFGKNASAGVISVVTQAPQFETGGSVSATYGNYNTFRVSGDITGPISDTVAYALAGNYNTRDGYADDLALGSELNDRNRYGFRGQLLFEPSEDLSIRLIGDFDKIDEVCCVAGNLVNGPTGAAIFALGGAIDPENPFSYDVYNNVESSNDIENSGVSGQVDYDFDFATLTSITSFRTSDLKTNQDSDFTSADLIGTNSNDTNIETFTQEIRFTSTGEGMIDWMVGGFYFDETVDIENQLLYGDDFRNYGSILAVQAAAAAAGGPVPTADQVVAGLNAGAIVSPVTLIEGALGLPLGTTLLQSGQGMTETFGQDNTAFSLFGTLDVHLTDRLTATVGLNYTQDNKDAFGEIANTDVFSAIDFVELGFAQALAGVGVDATDPVQVATFAQANPAVFGAIQAGAQDPATNSLLAFQPFQFIPPFLGFPNAVEGGSTNDSSTDYTLRLAYDLTDNINVYGSYATGFKASSWNLSRDSRPLPSDFIPGSRVTAPASSPIRDAGLAVSNLTTGTRFAGPEESEVFEIGLKAAYDSVAFNVAIFDQTIEGFQSNVFTGTGFALANAGEQSVTGLEFDATWSPVSDFTLTLAGTFLDPTYDSFEESATGDISGTQPSTISETSLSAAATYNFVVNNWDAFVRGDWQYESEADYFDAVEAGSGFPDNQALLGYGREANTFNASAGLTTEGGISLTVWGRNIFDDEYILTAFPSVAQSGSLSGYPNQPATYGVTVKKSF